MQRPGARTVIVGIAGGSGSGKSTVARKLVASFAATLGDDAAVLIAHDAYYRDRGDVPPAAREALNFDEPDALDNDRLIADVAALRAGAAIECPEYDFVTHTRRAHGHRVESRPLVVVDGMLLFAVPALRDAFDLRVFVDTPDAVRLERRVARDVAVRGRTRAQVEAQFAATVRPMHERHVEPSRAHAHLIVAEGGENDVAIGVVVERVRALIG